MTLNVEQLLRTAQTLEKALLAIEQHRAHDDVLFYLYRNAPSRAVSFR